MGVWFTLLVFFDWSRERGRELRYGWCMAADFNSFYCVCIVVGFFWGVFADDRNASRHVTSIRICLESWRVSLLWPTFLFAWPTALGQFFVVGIIVCFLLSLRQNVGRQTNTTAAITSRRQFAWLFCVSVCFFLIIIDDRGRCFGGGGFFMYYFTFFRLFLLQLLSHNIFACLFMTNWLETKRDETIWCLISHVLLV